MEGLKILLLDCYHNKEMWPVGLIAVTPKVVVVVEHIHIKIFTT